MQDSDNPLLWWKVETLVVSFVKENFSQKSAQINCLLVVDLSEQFESAPMMTEPLAGMFEEINSDRKLIHSRKSSSLPLVGAYRDINKISVLSEILKRTAENLSWVDGIFFTHWFKLLCQHTAEPCHTWLEEDSTSSLWLNISGVDIRKLKSGNIFFSFASSWYWSQISCKKMISLYGLSLNLIGSICFWESPLCWRR